MQEEQETPHCPGPHEDLVSREPLNQTDLEEREGELELVLFSEEKVDEVKKKPSPASNPARSTREPRPRHGRRRHRHNPSLSTFLVSCTVKKFSGGTCLGTRM